ncbi:hypothetical protein D3C72_379050 [compost metagenome]
MAVGLRGQQLVDDAVFVMHVQAAVLAHHDAIVFGRGDRFTGEEPLDGDAEAAGNVEQRRNRRVGEVAFQLADVAGGEFALLRQFRQGHAPAFAQAANARAEEMRFGVAGCGLCGAAVAHGQIRTGRSGANPCRSELARDGRQR